MKFKTYEKQFSIKAAGVEITPEILAKINHYAVKELTAEDVYVRKYLMAYNAVDRDNERFTEILLDDFAKTFPGKSFLVGHDRSAPGIGLYFAAATENLTPEQFKELTGEEAPLPEGLTSVKVLYGWIYLVKADFNEKIIANIDAGIYRHASIGFRASDLKPIKGQYDNILYWEYSSPGEALEGSLVWLGAQPGATAQKSADDNVLCLNCNKFFDYSKQIEIAMGAVKCPECFAIVNQEGEALTEKNNSKKGGKNMEKLLKMLMKLFPGKSFTEEGLGDEIKAALDEHVKAESQKAVDAASAPLNQKIAELTPLAADGKAYRDGMVSSYVAQKAKLEEVSEKPEDQKALREVVEKYPVDFLKSEVAHLQKRVEEKFPANPQTQGDDRRDKSGGEADKNQLIPEEEKEGK